MKKLAFLLAFLLALAGGITLLETTRRVQPKETAALLEEAATRTALAFSAIKEERLRRNGTLDPQTDPNATGMLGPEYTAITTTLGNLEAKRTATNPNMAAVICDMLLELGVGEGDRVAVNLSGSFPTLNIALLCALDTLGAEGIVLASVGASTYGATDPSFTYLDMEHYLYENGYVGTRSSAFSMGGERDLGLEMPEEVREAIIERLGRLGYAHMAFEDVEANLSARYTLYGEAGNMRCFVNVGGNLAAYGSGSGMDVTAHGILRDISPGERGNGLIQRYLRTGTPVIQLLNVKGLATAYGMPVDPVPLPAVGEGAVYKATAYRPALVALVLAVVLGFIGAAIYHKTRKRKDKESREL